MITFLFVGVSELEIDERLEVGGDELVEGHGQGYAEEAHEPQGHGGEPEAVAAFEARREPVDKHAGGEEEEDGGIVGEDVGTVTCRGCLPVTQRMSLPNNCAAFFTTNAS